MDKRRERRLDLLVDCGYGLLLAGGLYLGARYLFPLLFPLIMGFTVAVMLRPLALGLSRRTGIRAGLAGCLLLLLAYAVIVLVLVAFLGLLMGWLQTVMAGFPAFYRGTLLPMATALDQRFDRLLERVSPDFSGNTLLQGGVQTFQGWMLSLLGKAAAHLGALGSQLPGLMASLAFSVACSVIVSSAYEDITAFVLRQLSPPHQVVLHSVKKGVLEAVASSARSGAVMLVATFAQLTLGFWLLGIRQWLSLAVLVCILDLLPVLGVGSVLLPWAAVCFFQGNAPLGIGLLLLWGVIISVRGLLEIRMAGKQLGLHPLVGIMAVYLGYQSMGVVGVFLLPLLTALVVRLHRAGLLSLWKS